MKFKNCKGTSKIMSVYWFVILVLVAGAIVYMVSIFYGHPYDVREIEANILINKVADCLSENGKLNDNLFDKEGAFNEEFRILEECHLNFNTADNEGQYYIEIESKEFKITEGNINLKTFFETSPSSSSIFKSEKSFYVLNDKNEELIVKVLAVISKTKENVG